MGFWTWLRFGLVCVRCCLSCPLLRFVDQAVHHPASYRWPCTWQMARNHTMNHTPPRGMVRGRLTIPPRPYECRLRRPEPYPPPLFRGTQPYHTPQKSEIQLLNYLQLSTRPPPDTRAGLFFLLFAHTLTDAEAPPPETHRQANGLELILATCAKDVATPRSCQATHRPWRVSTVFGTPN